MAETHTLDPLLRYDPEFPFRWLYFDLNSYFASVEQQEDPALRGKPVGVVPSEGENTSLIAASIEAKRCGVKTGTPVWEARRLCPGIALRPARHGLYVEWHHRILEEIDRHVPVERVWSIDEVSIRLTGPQRRPEAALDLARAIKAGIAARVGGFLLASIGLAPSRHLAKLASDMRKPDGLVALRMEDLPGPLLDLELRDIPGIGRGIADRLARCGVADVSALWAMGPKRARMVWGSVEGERFWYGLRGADLPEPPLRTTPRSIGHARVLPPKLRDAEGAQHVSRLLAMKAMSRLRDAGCLTTMLGLGARPPRQAYQRAGSWHGDTRLHQTDDERVVLAELDRLWARMRGEGALLERFSHVAVTLAGLVEKASATPDLFDAAPRPTPGAGLARAISQVHHRFGRDSLIFGSAPRDRDAFAVHKIVFTRVPDREAGSW